MQKLELRNHLHELLVGLKSKEVVSMLDAAQVDPNTLLTNIINSKAAFDRASTNDDMTKVFEQFDLQKIYETHFFSGIIGHISRLKNNQNKLPRTHFLNDNNLTTFYSQHKTLIATFNIVENLLLEGQSFFDANQNFDISTAQNNGNLILQIIDEGNVPLKKTSEILESLEQLIETVYLLFDKVENEQFSETPTISMIDSGSDINISIKMPKKAANLLAQIFKQMWDLIANNKSFRHNQKLKDVENTISVMGKIEEAKSQGSIDPEMAEVLKKGLYENTKNVILKNTLTKEIVIESRELSNRQVLLEQTKTYQLEQGEKDTEKNKSESQDE